MRVMSTNPSFLQSSADGEVKNLRDWGIPLGRRFRALKLWFVIREQGVTGLQKRLRRDMANARWLAEEVAATPGWRVVAPVLCKRSASATSLGPDGARSKARRSTRTPPPGSRRSTARARPI